MGASTRLRSSTLTIVPVLVTKSLVCALELLGIPKEPARQQVTLINPVVASKRPFTS